MMHFRMDYETRRTLFHEALRGRMEIRPDEVLPGIPKIESNYLDPTFRLNGNALASYKERVVFREYSSASIEKLDSMLRRMHSRMIAIARENKIEEVLKVTEEGKNWETGFQKEYEDKSAVFKHNIFELNIDMRGFVEVGFSNLRHSDPNLEKAESLVRLLCMELPGIISGPKVK